MTIPLFEINPALDRRALAHRFREHGRVQVRDVLTPVAAQTVRRVLEQETPWGFGWQAGAEPHKRASAAEMAAMSALQRQTIANGVHVAGAAGEYAVRFNSFPMLDAYLARTAPSSPLDLLVEHINDQPFLGLLREVTGIAELIKADAQATLYAPGDFLSVHTDSHVAEGWRVAYVLNLADADWRPDWGGYLNFLNDEGDVVEGWRPRFNVLNLLAVPQPHQVSYVAPFAPIGRFAITGWARDR